MLNDPFEFSWPDSCDIVADISWTKPSPHDLLFSGGIDENDSAYFYSIVAYAERDWWPYYIGMTHRQSASIRNKQADHRARLSKLKFDYPSLTFSISLGTPTFATGTLSEANIKAVEGLLIYTNWHEKMDNSKNVARYAASMQIYVRNVGWNAHLYPESAYGAFYRGH